MCGKKALAPSSVLCWIGSPPHVREKDISVPPGEHEVRITPACAGKRMGLLRIGAHCWDHPRMCGKKPVISLVNESGRGSPPHVREKVGWG